MKVYLIIAALFMHGVLMVNAAAAFEYGDYSKDIRAINTFILDECKKAGVISKLDPHEGRKACGLAMRGQQFAGHEEAVFYTRNKLENGFRDVLGVETHHEQDGEMYSLVRSLNTETYRPYEQPEQVTSYADATLFVKREQGWEPVWRFVNLHKNDWHKANTLFPEQQGLSPQVAKMIDRLWQQTVVMGTHKLAFHIKDTQGPV